MTLRLTLASLSHPLRQLCGVLALAGLAAAGAAQAEIHIGVIVSTTGPGASLGIPAEQASACGPLSWRARS